ncbi:MAG: type II secretion system protein GspN [Desulfobacterales bacterium]|nr:type II secretion system protein GspN [Desulfobacterales bacterium]
MKKWIAYIAYVIIILAAFLYLLFPSADIKNYIIQRAERFSPAVSVAIGSVSPCLAPGLKFSDLDISLRGQAVFNASEIRIRPKYLSLLSENKTFLVKGDVYGGTLDGKARIKNRSGSEYSSDVTFVDVQIRHIGVLNEILPHEIYGDAAGSIQYTTKNGSWGNGEAEITITGCRLELKPPIFGVKDLAPGKVNAVIKFQNRRASVQKITVDGEQMAGNVSGTIDLDRQLANSRLRLSGTIKPYPSLIKELGKSVPSHLLSKSDYADKGIAFRVSGTIGRPNFSLR